MKKTVKTVKVDWKARYQELTERMNGAQAHIMVQSELIKGLEANRALHKEIHDPMIAKLHELETEVEGSVLVNGQLSDEIDSMKLDIAHYIEAAGWWMDKWVGAQTSVNRLEVLHRHVWVKWAKADLRRHNLASVVRWQRWGILFAILVLAIITVVFGW